MATIAYMHRITQERGGDIRFIRAEENRKPCWFYLRLAPEKRNEYEQKIKSGNLNIRDYGQILESDWGHYPPPDVVSFMREEYQFITPPME